MTLLLEHRRGGPHGVAGSMVWRVQHACSDVASSIHRSLEWGRTSTGGRGETTIGGRPTIIRVRFTGLRGAAHLNGREGVIGEALQTDHIKTRVESA